MKTAIEYYNDLSINDNSDSLFPNTIDVDKGLSGNKEYLREDIVIKIINQAREDTIKECLQRIKTKENRIYNNWHMEYQYYTEIDKDSLLDIIKEIQ